MIKIELKDNIQKSYTVEKSVFICNLIKVKTKEEAENKIKEYSKFDARHNCYAFSVVEKNNNYVKFSDDGEPQGTAGLPILDVIKKKNLSNILVLVTRYFGGIKLGKPGLINAYRTSVLNALQDAILEEKILSNIYTFKVDFKLYNKIKKELTNLAKILNIEYKNNIEIELAVPLNTESLFINLLNKNNINLELIKKIDQKYI